MSALEQDAPRGFVTKAEHYKALAEIDRLKDELESTKRRRPFRFAEGDLPTRTLALRALFPDIALSPRICVLMLAEKGAVANESLVHACSSTMESVKIHVMRARRALEAAGAPPKAITTQYGVGYAMTEEARAWLKERVPEAFEAKGVAR